MTVPLFQQGRGRRWEAAGTAMQTGISMETERESFKVSIKKTHVKRTKTRQELLRFSESLSPCVCVFPPGEMTDTQRLLPSFHGDTLL